MDACSPTRNIDKASSRRNLLKLAGLYAILIAIVSGSYLLAPPARVQDKLCGRTVHLGALLSFPLNCDSPELVLCAVEPSHLLVPNSIRQDRPVYVILAALVTRLVLASEVWRLVPMGIYRSIAVLHAGTSMNLAHLYLCGYLAYIVMNAVVILATLLLFHWLVVQQWSANLIVIGFASLLLTNDVVKAFFWTPHLQLFNLMVPLCAVAFAQEIFRRPNWSIRWLGAIGLTIGLFSLAYGSFAVCVATGVVALALRLRWFRPCISFREFLANSGVLAVGFALPTLAWIETCKIVAGSYYNLEFARYHEFAWVEMSEQVGIDHLCSDLASNMHLFLNALLPVLLFAVLLLIAVLATGLVMGAPMRSILAERGFTLIAIAITIAVCFGFFYFAGLYKQRLGQNLAIPMLLAAASVGVEIARRTRLSFALSALSLWTVVVVRLLHEVAKPGPWN